MSRLALYAPLNLNLSTFSATPIKARSAFGPFTNGKNFRGVAYHFGDLDNAVAGIRMVAENESSIESIANQNWRCADKRLAALGLPTYIMQV